MPILAFLVAIAYMPGISGVGNSPRWALLSVVIPAMMLVPGPLRSANPDTSAPVHVAGAIFLLYAIFSMTWTVSGWDGLDQIWKFILLGMVFMLGARMENMRPVYTAFGLGIGVNSLVMIAQKFFWPELVVGSGLFFNPNFAGEAAVLALVATAAEGLWVSCALAWPSLILSGARGAVLALCVAALAWVWQRQKLLAALIALLVATLVGASLSLGKGIASISERLDLWADVVQQLTVFGHGVGSFVTAFPKGATHIDTLALHFDHAHNDILEIAFQFGLPGGAFVGVVAYTLYRSAKPTEFLVLVAFMVTGLVGFPLFEPATAFLAALVAGHACGSGSCLRDVTHERGMDVLWPATLAAWLQRHREPSANRGKDLPAQLSVSHG